MDNTGTIAFSACGSSNYPYNCNVYKTSLSTLRQDRRWWRQAASPKSTTTAHSVFLRRQRGLCTQSEFWSNPATQWEARNNWFGFACNQR